MFILSELIQFTAIESWNNNNDGMTIYQASPMCCECSMQRLVKQRACPQGAYSLAGEADGFAFKLTKSRMCALMKAKSRRNSMLSLKVRMVHYGEIS